MKHAISIQTVNVHLNGAPILVEPGSTSEGRFEILAITAGEGNGWFFSEEVLQASLPLWHGAECFIDHALWPHSLRDLAGVCSHPQWDGEAKGIKMALRPGGPAAPLLEELAGLLLGEGEKPKVGFSADILMSAKDRQVQAILKVNSVDLVIDPARGGAFLRALYSNTFSKEMIAMTEPTKMAAANPPDDFPRSEGKEPTILANKADAAHGAGLEMCGCLLEAALHTSRLPAPMANQVRRQFSGRLFEAGELNNAIEEARQVVSDLTGSLVVQGPGRVHAMFSSEDALQAAVDDLFGIEREAALKNLHTARLQGIRELYLMLTGDDDLHGGYYPERVRLATTADFTGLIKNALNKIVANEWRQLGDAGYDWWKAVCVVEHFNSLQSITGTLVGTVGALPVVAEGAEYTELAIGDSPETASFTKYGGYIPLSLELIDRDDTRKIKAYPRELAAAGLRKISALVAGIFTQNSGAGPTMADGGALFNATAVTSAGGHANLLTAALSPAQWDVVQAAVYNQPMLIKNTSGFYGTGPRLAINPRYLLVPRTLWLTAAKILYPTWENNANIHSENMQHGGTGDVVVVPDWTDANDWAAACDPRLMPSIFIGERFGIMPEIFIAGDNLSPAVFMNDEQRLKVRFFLALWVNDFRPLHKENVP